MDDNVVSLSLGTQPNPLTSQLRIDVTDGGIDDPQSPIFETGPPRADDLTRNPVTALHLFDIYLWIVCLIHFSTVFSVTIAFDGFSTYRSNNYDKALYDSVGHVIFYSIWALGLILGMIVWQWPFGTERFVGISVILLTTMGFIVLALLAFSEVGTVDIPVGEGFHPWRTGVLPTSPSVCKERLEDGQRILLEADYYHAQFTRTVVLNLTHPFDPYAMNFVYPAFNETRFLQIHNDKSLCYQGFEGNQDLYGLGVRLCIYLQWITALVTNNFLPDARQASRGAWLVFSIAMCIIVLVVSIVDCCVFGIEIEILYWLYWGGFVCVHASSPSQTRLGGQEKWVGLDLDSAIRYTMHVIMAWHGVWFSWWGYDQVFARMPCGTYQFILAKFLDPSAQFCYARDALSYLIDIIAIPALLAVPLAIIVMAAELKASIKDSVVYRVVSRSGTGQTLKEGRRRVQERDNSLSNGDESERRAASLLIRVSARFRNMIRGAYYNLRMLVGLPRYSLGGIRLITPVDARRRRYYRVGCLTVWLASFSISATAIETTLAWNRVTSVHSLTSLGQMLPLIIGMATFINVLWKLFKQELRRRQEAKRRTIAADDVELDTLPPLPLTFSGAIQSAFRQPDEGFLTDAAALPRFTTNIRYSDVVPDNDPYTMSGGAGPGRQSMDTTSEVGSLTEADWETATEGMSSVSDLTIHTETAEVGRD